MVLDPQISQLSHYLANFQVKNHLLSFIEEILVLPPFDKLFQDQWKSPFDIKKLHFHILLSNFVWKVEFVIGGAPIAQSAPKTLRSAQCGHEVQYVLFIKTFYPGKGLWASGGEEIKRIKMLHQCLSQSSPFSSFCRKRLKSWAKTGFSSSFHIKI